LLYATRVWQTEGRRAEGDAAQAACGGLMPEAARLPPTLVGLVAIGATMVLCLPRPAVAAALFCPRGEITLSSDVLRIARSRGRDRVVSLGSSFVVPEGSAIDPVAEPVAFSLEADHRVLETIELPAGALEPRTHGNTFVFTQREPGGAIGRHSFVSVGKLRDAYRLRVRLTSLDLADLDLGDPPQRVKQLLKIGDDCFSSLLLCSAQDSSLICKPERNAVLRGRVQTGPHRRLAGAMLTAFDDARLESVSVFSQADGRYVFPRLRPGSYRLRARLIGYEDVVREGVTLAPGEPATEVFKLTPAADTNSQLPASHWFSLLLDDWPNPTIRGDFTLSCGNCHQIGAYRFRRDKTEEEWTEVVTRMMTFLPPYFQETRDLMLPTLLDAFGPEAPIPALPLPEPPSGDVLRAVIYEYGLGDESFRPGCHDLELGLDNVVYADAGVRWIDPRSGERGTFPIIGGAHSIERAPDGNMWITQAGEDVLARMDVHTGEFTYYPLPRIGDDQGSYPHTLRFDSQGRIWFTLTKSNHLAVFDPATEQFSYFDLPTSDPAETGLPIPVAYGCDTAPDDTVWYSQLFGQRIGHFDPATRTLEDFRPPFYGPRRLHADGDGIVWVPGYASGVLGRFDPAIERWKVYPLPTGIQGPPGMGTSETPYSLNANRMNGEVWINGSNSDTLIRFDPASEQFTAFPLPTRASFTREIEFDSDNNVWTCTSNEPPGPGERGRGKFVKVELPPTGAECGNGRLEVGEECDDGDADDCNTCTTDCTLVTGCGDGVVCGDEPCDDGNADSCDGCSSACEPEPGLRCGDGTQNEACGEECEPPGSPGCTAQCTAFVGCGDGVVQAGEACDDGNTEDCDECTAECVPVIGCGDGVVCGVEQCDDGNTASCDGCSSACEPETGYLCGDGIIGESCGEECDPPTAEAPECNYLCRLGAAPPLGTRHLSFGGASYTSALGTGIPLGTLIGDMDLVAGAPGLDGIADVSVSGPIFYKAPILGGAFGYICVKIGSCTGIVDCNGGTPVGVEIVQDSAGPGRQDNPHTVTTGLGDDGGPGATLLGCSQAVVQVQPPEPECATVAYPPEETIAYTTGRAEGRYENGDPRIGTGQIEISGENFSCADWAIEDGAGMLAGPFLMEADPQAGDTANVNVIDD
jgi:cysteine-rich repeat protein